MEINELEMVGCLCGAFQHSSVLSLLLSCLETCAVFSKFSFHSACCLLDFLAILGTFLRKRKLVLCFLHPFKGW